MKKICFLILMLSCLQMVYSQANDSSAIKILLEKESATWRSGDAQAHAACWKVQPYSRMLVSTADGKCFDVPPETMLHPPAGMMGKGGTSVNTNYTFSIHGNDAWVSHDETSTAADGGKTYSHEIKLLEKINGGWKLVGQSIHVYKRQ